MQVIAFTDPSIRDWRWRIVDHSGDMVEESRATFLTIGEAVAEGGRRLVELNDAAVSTRWRPRWRAH